MWGKTAKMIVPLVQGSTRLLAVPHVNSGKLLVAIFPLTRNLSSQRLTKSIELITNTPKPLALVGTNNSSNNSSDHDKRKFAVEASSSATFNRGQEEAPLVIIMSWLMAKRVHIMKYAQAYLDSGAHVLSVTCSPAQLLFPAQSGGAKSVGKDLLTFMSNNPQYNRNILLHGFSVGAFVWAQTMEHMNGDREKYQPVINNIVGQIWDSVVDFEGISQGIGTALFPRNALLRNTIQAYVRFHCDTFQSSATQHYLNSSLLYHNTIVRAPSLFLSSRDDPVAFYYIVERVMDRWEQLGVEVFCKTWDQSPHVSHMWKHPVEYKAEVKAFLDKLGLLRKKHHEKFQTKVAAATARN